MFRWLLLVVGLAVNVVTLPLPLASAEETENFDSKARWSTLGEASEHLVVSPVNLQGGSKLTLISPADWSSLAGRLSESLTKSHQTFTKLFGSLPQLSTSVRLMDEESFFKKTGTPRWTNALYFRNQIIIPLSQKGKVDFQNLDRSVRHEYTHAIINALSAGQAPGWLDEGLAQWAEGQENPALKPALDNWLRTGKSLIPLRLLQGGFTRLETGMVAAAYAESLYAARGLMDIVSFPRIRSYFEALRGGMEKQKAFELYFGMSESKFEKMLEKELMGNFIGGGFKSESSE